jgi:hypothetical protein
MSPNITQKLLDTNILQYGDTATISGSCGKVSHVCQEFKGIDKKTDKGESPKLTSTSSCLGAQGKLAKLPTC